MPLSALFWLEISLLRHSIGYHPIPLNVIFASLAEQQNVLFVAQSVPKYSIQWLINRFSTIRKDGKGNEPEVYFHLEMRKFQLPRS